MPITENDIKLLQSARMTDTPDGGGRMTGNVVQSGVDNNIFDDVSNLDRVYGNVALRKVFPSVLTNTTDKYLGCRVIIDEAPADPNVHGLLFDASSLFDTREQAKIKVEGYLSTGAATLGYLYGNHITGQAVITIAMPETQPDPAIGFVFVLNARVADTGTASNEQFVRVTSVTSTLVDFNVSGGNKYKLRICSCEISDPLRYNFPGWGPNANGVITADDLIGANITKTMLYDAQVADASQYYGIRPLAVAATTGAFNVKADSSFSHLLPSAQIESPIPDAMAGGFLVTPSSIGGLITFDSADVFNTTHSLFIGAAVARGTLSVGWPGVTSQLMTDNGKGALVFGGTEVGSIDYTNGILALSTAVAPEASTTSKTITYEPAVEPLTSLRSDYTHIDITTRSMSFVKTLATKPAKGTASVSFMSGGRWYVLRDYGDYALTGLSSGQGAGSVNPDTSTVTVTLGALPDVGSDLIYQWSDATLATLVDMDAQPDPKAFYADFSLASGDNIMRDLVTVTWTDYYGASKTINCTNGVSTGDGKVFFKNDRTIGVVPEKFPAINATYTVSGTRSGRANYAAANAQSFSFGEAVKPGTVYVPVAIDFTYTLTDYDDWKAIFFPVPGWTISTNGKSISLNQTLAVRDDGNGVMQVEVLMFGGHVKVPVGTVNYTTGAVTINASTVGNSLVPGPILHKYQDVVGAATQPFISYPAANRTCTLAIAAQAVTVSATVSTPVVFSQTFSATAYRFDMPAPDSGRVAMGLTFYLDSMVGGPGSYFRTRGTLYRQSSTNPNLLERYIDRATGVGEAAGTIASSGGVMTITLTASVPSNLSDPSGLTVAYVYPTSYAEAPLVSDRLVFRTATAPIRPGSFNVVGTMSNGAAFNLVADSAGKILSNEVAGVINYETGVCVLYGRTIYAATLFDTTKSLPGFVADVVGVSAIYPALIRTASVRYSAVAYTYLPLDAAVLGLDPVRLPSDGRVPVFKAGRVVVIHNTVKMTPVTVANSQTVNCGRTRLARIRVFGSDGLEITSGFTKHLDGGTVTFTNVAGFAQPVVVEHRIEDEALCAEAQITGDLRLTRPLTHDFPADTSYVSSALVKGTLQAAAQDSFAQETWTNVWSDSRIGPPILPQYNDTTNPIAVTNAGAITERWLLQFTNNTEFNVIGEEVGQIITGNTAAMLAPVNPATGVPYFTLQPAGWGSGWVAGNVLRFNTVGAGFPLWLSRTVMQSPSSPPGTDQMTISIRGDIDQ